ncbi:MAG TPA: outer membrane beta-barrel protein, partial [Candidatus Acidoferrales bacterium]|nr:outer membrane beta-barrel protein [Candidatus Acidoferrales bacterium]
TLTQLGVGGDLHVDNVRGRLLTQFGLYSSTQPRNDPSIDRGQWDLNGAYRYLAEAYGGYHFNVLKGINVDAGIFLSYIGLFSFYNYDNWSYQPSYVSSNTPWFFNGIRMQIFPTNKLKIEPWFINGWQSYGQINKRPGLGMEVLWRPNGSISIVSNNYGLGRDALGAPERTRWHTDDSIEVKYYDTPDKFIDKAALSVTIDAGCESGSGVACFGGGKNGAQKQSFLGFMFYDRVWFHKDLYAFTVGGGGIDNPGRYLVLLPPINGATAFSGTPYFTENPGDPFKAWDVSGTFDYMPSQFVTFRMEFNHRAANVPYFSGPGGITPPGGNQGAPGSAVFLPNGSLWTPDLRKYENRATFAILVKF